MGAAIIPIVIVLSRLICHSANMFPKSSPNIDNGKYTIAVEGVNAVGMKSPSGPARYRPFTEPMQSQFIDLEPDQRGPIAMLAILRRPQQPVAVHDYVAGRPGR